MKTQINFNFKGGEALKFAFELTENNMAEISASMVRNFEKKVFLLQSGAAKYFKKSSVLSNRKFSMDIYIENKFVKTVFSGIETSNGLLKDGKALEELLTIMMFEAVDNYSIPELAEIVESPKYKRTTEDGEIVYFNSKEEVAEFDNMMA